MDASLLKPVMPREHGVWVIAFVPLLTALAISFPGSNQSIAPLAWFCGAVLLFFMSFTPFVNLMKKSGRGKHFTVADRNFLWASIYLVFSALFFIHLLYAFRLWPLLLFLLPIGGIYSYYCHLLRQGENRDNLAMDILGAMGLCLVAPMVYYVAARRWDIPALMIYLINLGFFSTRIIFAKQMINLKEDDPALANFKSRRKYLRNVSILNVVIIHLLVLFSILKMIPAAAVTSLLPGSIYTWKQIFSLKKKPSIRGVGFKEMGVAFCFCAALIYAYH